MATQDISQLVVDVKSQGIQTAANQLDKLAAAADKAETAVKKLGTAVVGVNGMMTGGVAQTTALITAITSLTVVINRMSQTQTRATVATRASNEAMAEAHALARGLSGSLGALWVTYGNLMGMGVGITIGASLKGIVSVGKDVEQTLEQIRVLGGASTEEVAQMSAMISDLGKGTQGPKEVAEAFNVLTLAGLNAKEAMQGVQAALNLSVAGGVSIEKSSETLVQVGSALGYTAAGFDTVADVIAKTAAASMSSVDSISNAFKSAAAVGEVYGASLNDIAVGLAAIANLGIQGTSAGTALKNFYKDLSASTQKVTNTMKDMHLSISDFRDSKGFMLPLVDVVTKLNQGLGALSGKARQIALVKLFSQQGVREGAELLKLVNTASTEIDKEATERLGKVTVYANKLAELQGQIKESAAFATLAAIAMAQTTQNQLKSVSNTLQTTLNEAFKAVAPQIGEVARALKSAFGSQEFKDTLVSLATGVADLTKFLVENAKALGMVAAAWAAWKVVEAAAGVVKMAQAFELATVATTAFGVSLGPIFVAIMGLATAWAIYKANKDNALDNHSGTNNLQEYIDNTTKAAQREAEIIEMRKNNATEADILRKQQLDADKDMAAQAVNASAKELQAKRDFVGKLYKDMDDDTKVYAEKARKMGLTKTSFTAIDEYISAQAELDRAETVHTNQVKLAENAEKSLAALRQQNADAAQDAARKALENRPTGSTELSGKADVKGINDAYNAAIKVQQDIMKAASQELANFRAQEQAKFKSGQIGQIQMINETADAEVRAAIKTAEAARKAQAKANSTPNKTADAERFKAEAERALADAEQAQKMRNENTLAAARAMETQLTHLKVKALEDQGRFIEAANLKWSSEGKLALEQAQRDLEAYGSRFPWLAELVKAYADVRDQAMNAARLKEDALAFDTALLQLQGTLKGFKAGTFGKSIGGIFDEAVKQSKAFDEQLVKTKEVSYQLMADAYDSPEGLKKFEEANKNIAAMTDKQKAMWQEVGETITKSLGDAFGSAGTAMGGMYKAMLEYRNTENATAEDRMKQYGDMAQAASGFFDKQSKGYRLLSGIAQVFHVAQMARTMAQTAASVVAGAAQFFAQSGWGGFAGVAAMGAVLAGLGWSMSGASAHGADPTLEADYVQKRQGTGTVLGDADAKSKSITEAIDDLKSNSDIMLPLTQGMLNSLKNIEDSMKGLAKLAVQSGVTNASNMNIDTYSNKSNMSWMTAIALGGITAPIVKALGSLWGKTTQEITDSGLQFGGKVSDLEAGKGIDQYAAIKQSSSSWFGLVKNSSSSVKTQGVSDDVSRQFGLVFTNLEDSLKSAAGALGSSSNAVGEAIDNVVLQTTKISLKDLKGQDLTDAINNVLSAAMDQIAKAAYPQMGAFQRVGEGYAQTVVRVATGVEQANVSLEKFGITAVNYADVINKQGDVAFEITKQSILATEGMSGIADMLKNMTGTIDDLTTAYKALDDIRNQMNLIGLNGKGLNLDMVKGAGGTSQLQSALNTYQDKYFTDEEKSAIMLKSVTAEFKKLGQALPTTKSALRALIEQTSVSNPILSGQLLALAGDYDKLSSSATEANKTAIESLNDTIDGLKKFKDTLTSLKNALALGDLSPLTPMQKFLEAKRQYEDTVSKAKAGDATAQGNVSGMAQAYLEASRVVNASSQGYTDTYNQVMKDIDAMSASTDSQLSNAEKQLAALQDMSITIGTMSKSSADMASDLTTLANAPQLPVSSNGAVVIDTSALEAQVKELKQQLADNKEANDAAIAKLTEALFVAEAQGAATISDAVKSTATTTAYVQQTLKNLNTER
jgi:TP901 family phage tail tape measure protein